jgi:hypothetical protein
MTGALPTPDFNSDHKLDCPPNPIPVTKWRAVGNVWPTVNGWYNMLRPENLRDELVEAGVASFVNGRWLVFPDKWQQYCAKNHRPRVG